MSTPHDFILFDLDGTLSDPLQGIGRSMNYALRTLAMRSASWLIWRPTSARR